MVFHHINYTTPRNAIAIRLYSRLNYQNRQWHNASIQTKPLKSRNNMPLFKGLFCQFSFASKKVNWHHLECNLCITKSDQQYRIADLTMSGRSRLQGRAFTTRHGVWVTPITYGLLRALLAANNSK